MTNWDHWADFISAGMTSSSAVLVILREVVAGALVAAIVAAGTSAFYIWHNDINQQRDIARMEGRLDENAARIALLRSQYDVHAAVDDHELQLLKVETAKLIAEYAIVRSQLDQRLEDHEHIKLLEENMSMHRLETEGRKR